VPSVAVTSFDAVGLPFATITGGQYWAQEPEQFEWSFASAANA
jgi:hypothetical protein